MRRWLTQLAILTVSVMLDRTCIRAEDGPGYLKEIRPILASNCFSCHGPDASVRQAGLRLDDGNSARVRLQNGSTAIVAGRPADSELIRRIETSDPELMMPPPDSRKVLTADEKQLLRQWIESGAESAEHWAYIAPKRPKIPMLSQAEWVRNPVDAFVLASIEASGMVPSPMASRETLLRRVSLDLIGLPPTLDELESFLLDSSPDAYENAVDRLLASPHFGEKLAQDWLDLARFGDTSGYQDDNDRPNHPYRDAVIRAFNANQPFDQFTIESLAGDLLPEPTISQKVLSGFNRLHRYNEEGGSDLEEFRVVYAVDRTNTTAATWMGVSFGCAQCHDHKYDPFTQREYYQLLAFFNSLKGEITVSKGPANPPQIPVPDPAQQERIDELSRLIAGQESHLRARESQTTAAFEEWLRQPLTSLPSDKSAAADQRTEQQLARLRYLREFAPDVLELQTRLSGLQKEMTALQQGAPLALVWEEMDPPRPTEILTRGDYQQPGERVERNVPAIFPPLPADAPRNRLTLARWLVNGEHPLTARVAVNRYGKMLFGAGLVRTPDDFGIRGEMPTHPELLDWLAVEFQNGWDVKRLLRLLVTSATNRQSSSVDREQRERDPDNRLLARGARYRLSAEEIRDAALTTSGLLTRNIGGRSVFPYQPDHFYRDKEDDPNEWKWPVETGSDLYRRGLYTFIRRTSPYPSFQTFDVSGRGECTVARARTNTPLQALVTLNDPVFIEAARVVAERAVSQTGSNPRERLNFLVRSVLSRSPSAAEQSVLERLYQSEFERYQADPDAAAKVRSQGSAAQSPGFDVAEVAAWTTVANALFNLDEAITRE